MSFSSSPKVTPTTGAAEQWKKPTLQWKPMELGGVPIKKKWIFPLRLIFYVCSSARNWVSSMYKGIDQFPLGSSNLDVWSSWTGTLKKHQVTRNDKYIFVLFKKMSFSSSPKVTPTTGVVEQWKKQLCNENQWNWVVFLFKKKWIFPLRLIFYVCSSARNWVSSVYKGIDQFPLGSSNPGCLKFLNWRTFQEKKVPWNDLYCIKKMGFLSSPKGTPTTGVVELW